MASAWPRSARVRGRRGFAARRDRDPRRQRTTGHASGRSTCSLGRLLQSQARRREAGNEYAAAREVVARMAASLPDGPVRRAFRGARSEAPARSADAFGCPRGARNAHDGLTARERDVAALIGRGLIECRDCRTVWSSASARWRATPPTSMPSWAARRVRRSRPGPSRAGYRATPPTPDAARHPRTCVVRSQNIRASTDGSRSLRGQTEARRRLDK